MFIQIKNIIYLTIYDKKSDSLKIVIIISFINIRNSLNGV